MTPTPQPKALELADWLAARMVSNWVHGTGDTPRRNGFLADALCAEAAAELRRQHAEIEALRKGLALVQQHHATAWNRGHAAGLRAARDNIKQANDAVKRDAWGNSQLTEALLAAESERDSLRAEVERLKQANHNQRLDICGMHEEVERLRTDAERDAALHEQMLDALRSAVLALAGINSMYNDCCAREYLKVSNAIAAAREAKG